MGLPKGYTGKTPLWNARRNLSFMITMHEKRKAAFAARLAEDLPKIAAAAKQVEELEAEEAK